MRNLLQTLTLAGITCFAFHSATIAQDTKSDQLGEYDEIVVKRNSNKDGKVTIEIKDGNVLVDGTKIDAYKDGDISVYRRRIRPVDGNNFNFNMQDRNSLQLFNEDEEGDSAGTFSIKPGKAVLGVFTEKKEAAGATVKEVAKETPAEKAGLKTGDVITRIDADKISEPQDLFEKIGTHEPGDTVTVTYLRDKKEYTAVVTLDERKSTGQPYPNNNDERGFSPRTPRGAFSFGDDFWGNTRDRFRNLSDNDPKLGLSVQDTESGNGAVVLDVKAGSPAEKAGFKTNDIITALAGVTISSTRDVTNAYRENKSKGTITAQVKRGGQQKTLQIQVPKKLHKADL